MHQPFHLGEALRQWTVFKQEISPFRRLYTRHALFFLGSLHPRVAGTQHKPLLKVSIWLLLLAQGTSGSVTVSKLDLQTYTSEFDSHWAPHSFGLVPHRSKEFCKLLPWLFHFKHSADTFCVFKPFDKRRAKNNKIYISTSLPRDFTWSSLSMYFHVDSDHFSFWKILYIRSM